MIKTTFAAAFAALLLASHVASAQQTPPPEASPSATQTQTDNDFRSTQLVGANVYNAANEDIGEIEDIIFDSGGSVSAVVVSVGGFLGIGEKYVAMPFKSLKIAREADKDLKITVEGTKDSLKAMPEYKFMKS